MSASTRMVQARHKASAGKVLLLAAVVLAAAWSFSAIGFTSLPGASADTSRNLHLSKHIAREAAQQRWEAEVSRKQALVAAAVLASGASRADAEDLKSKVKELMKQDPTPNDNGAPEKHIPKAYPGGGSVDVLVNHVMDKDKPHYIQYMWLKDANSDNILAVKAFQATDPTPALSVDLPAGTAAIPMLFCNLHGLWEGEKFTM
eukprot:TRINITY_DN18334_c0_g4_i1.p1 TRINITY_DN18334_c0_g4~~TRINITY_DN18334_c0_g4_i1.p1  ORF type:complete len:216 (-),score=62.94 TRINITY_DN18334_c0_g4_i1:64-672(-)